MILKSNRKNESIIFVRISLIILSSILFFLVSNSEVSGQWTKVFDDPNYNFGNICFLNADTGFVAGYRNTDWTPTIFKTTNGGETWNMVYVGPQYHFIPWSISFVNDTIGFAAGQDFAFWKTTDGGNSWEYFLTLGMHMDNYDLLFINENIGFAQNKRTTNGGLTWTSQLSGSYIRRYSFMNDSIGIGAGSGGLFRTSNQGDDWEKSDPFENENFLSVSMINKYDGYACTDEGIITRTNNGGISWFITDTVPFLDFDRIQFTASETGYAVGKNYFIYKTTDYGYTWLPILMTSSTIRGMQFLDEKVGYISEYNGKVYKTINGGGIGSEPKPVNVFDAFIYSQDTSSSLKLYESVMDQQGNTYIIGNSKGSLYYKDSLFLSANGSTFIFKTDDTGEILWCNTIENESIFTAKIRCLSNEGFIVIRYANSVEWLSKYSTDGSLDWEEPLTGDYGFESACTDHLGNIYVSGYLGDVTYRSQTISSEKGSTFVLMTNSSGNILEFKTLADEGIVRMHSANVDSSYNFIMTGILTTPLIIDNDTIQNTSDSTTIITLKFDPGIEFQWKYAFISDFILPLQAIDRYNNIIVAASRFHCPECSYISKISSEGDKIYRMGGFLPEIKSIGVLEDNSLCIGGIFEEMIAIGDDTLYSFGNYDSFLIRVSENGETTEINQVWDSNLDNILTTGQDITLTGLFVNELNYSNKIYKSNYPRNIYIAKLDFTSGMDNTAFSRPIEILIYPNPTQGKFNLLVGGNLEEGSIAEIYNTSGQKLSQFRLTRNFRSIDLSSYQKGVYLIQVVSGKTTFVSKVILQ